MNYNTFFCLALAFCTSNLVSTSMNRFAMHFMPNPRQLSFDVGRIDGDFCEPRAIYSRGGSLSNLCCMMPSRCSYSSAILETDLCHSVSDAKECNL